MTDDGFRFVHLTDTHIMAGGTWRIRGGHVGTHLVALDSHEVGHADGVLDAAQLAWLERDLSAHRDRPTIVFVHHHPWPLGHAWMDTMPLRNGAELMDILARHAHVSWLIGGHVHSEQVIQRGALTMLTTPSTCIQLSKTTASGAHFDPGPPGFRVVDVEHGRLSSFVVHVR